LFAVFGFVSHWEGAEGCVGTGCTVGCVGTVDGTVTVDPELAGGGETVSEADGSVGTDTIVVDEPVSPDGAEETGPSIGADTATVDDPPRLIVGVTASASNAEDAGPELPCLVASAAAAAPPITAERTTNFLFDGDFALKMLVCGITALDSAAL
jgi:hypothetical protein